MLTLSLETMGLFALGVLWVNTLLIAADALKQHAELGRWRERLEAARGAGRLVRATVVAGEGPEAALATHSIDQIGRAMTVSGPQRILFTDRSARGALHGGRVEVDGREVRVVAASAPLVWCLAEGARGDRAAFDEAWPRASTFKGFGTCVERRVGPGQRVWLWLETAPASASEAPLRARLVSIEDPSVVVAAARAPLPGLVIAALVGVVVVTTLALWPPVFGVVSTLGAAAGVGFFLAIQPLGTAAREKGALPDRRRVGGLWERPTA
jgi:hypothetical protein